MATVNKTYIVVMRGRSIVKRYRARIYSDQSASMARGDRCKLYIPDPLTGDDYQVFHSVEGKPAARVAMEAVMFQHDGYDVEADRITILPRG